MFAKVIKQNKEIKKIFYERIQEKAEMEIKLKCLFLLP